MKELISREWHHGARLELSALLRAMEPFSQKREPSKALDKVDRADLKQFVDELDSHDIFKPEVFIKKGFKKNWVDAITVEHDGIILNDGSFGAATGVATLEFFRALANELGVESRTGYMGRTKQVEELRQRIVRELTRA